MGLGAVLGHAGGAQHHNMKSDLIYSMLQGAGPRMSLRDWAQYWATPAGNRRKLLNVVSLSLAGTPLEVHEKLLGSEI